METRTSQEIEESTERLLQDLRAVVQDGEELLRARVQDLSERGMAAREGLASALETARETRHRLEERAAEGLRATREMVREDPFCWLGIAFGTGLIVGFVLRR